jgi:hypothetical protein
MKSEIEVLKNSNTVSAVEEKKAGRLRQLYNRADKGLLVLVLLFVLSLPLFTPRIYASDEIKYFSYLPSILFDHDVNFTNEYGYFYNSNPKKYEDFKKSVLDKLNEKGLPYNDGPVGSAIMWSPFYLAAHGIANLGHALGLKSFKPDGFSTPYIWAVTLASLIYGFIGLILAYLLVRQFVPRFYAALAVAGVWYASPVIFYMSLTPPMSHANSLFAISLWLYVWYTTRGWRYDATGNFVPGLRRGSMWLLLGVLGGLMTTIREQDGLVMIIAAIESLYLYYYYWRNRVSSSEFRVVSPESRVQSPELAGKSLASKAQSSKQLLSTQHSALSTEGSVLRLFLGNLWLLFGLAISLIPLLTVYQALNGHPGPSKLVSDKLGFFRPEIFERMFRLMFDFDRGMFLWSPILLLAMVGLLLMLRERRLRLVAVGMLVAYFLELYISASFQTWTMAGSFGVRRLVGISPIYITGLAYLGYWLGSFKKGWHWRQRWQIVAVVFFIAWNFGLIIQFSAIRDEAGRQKLDFPRVVTDQFTAVPGRIITITQKFFTNRSSFYKQ